MIKTFLSKQFLKYIVVGVIGTGLDFLILYSLVQYLHIYYLISAIISIAIVFPISFSLNKFWTFDNKSKNYFNQAIKYILVSSAAWVINLSVLTILVELFEMWYILAKVFATAAAVIFNFFFTKNWAFNPKRRSQKL